MVTQSNLRVLLADDDAPFRAAMGKALKRRGFSVVPVDCGHEAVAAMREIEGGDQTTVTVLDLRMPDIDGLEVLRSTPDRRTPVIVLTGHGSVPDAVEAMRLGAFTFLTKPVDAHDLIPIIMQAVQPETPSECLVGQSMGLRMVQQVIRKVGASLEPVLILGESGVGKKLVARTLHRNCTDDSGAMVMVKARGCTHEDLADFGADARGTLYIDELSELSIKAQEALFALIENRSVVDGRTGQSKSFNGRVIVGSRNDLGAALDRGQILGDLYHRLQVIPLELQPLRQRSEDIMPILEHWLTVLGSDELYFEDKAVTALRTHQWPGNVRELVNLGRRLALFCSEGKVEADLVHRMLESNPFAPPHKPSPIDSGEPVEEISLELLERRHIEALMAHHKNISRVSRILGINRRTLQRKLRCWGLIINQ